MQTDSYRGIAISGFSAASPSIILPGGAVAFLPGNPRGHIPYCTGVRRPSLAAPKGLSAHFTASVRSGSTLSHSRHRNSVLPFAANTGRIRLLHLGHRSMANLPEFFLQPTSGTKVPAMSFCLVQGRIHDAGSNRPRDANLRHAGKSDVRGGAEAAREKVSNFLATAKTDDENRLAVEGLRYLRASKVSCIAAPAGTAAS